MRQPRFAPVPELQVGEPQIRPRRASSPHEGAEPRDHAHAGCSDSGARENQLRARRSGELSSDLARSCQGQRGRPIA